MLRNQQETDTPTGYRPMQLGVAHDGSVLGQLRAVETLAEQVEKKAEMARWAMINQGHGSVAEGAAAAYDKVAKALRAVLQ